MSKLVTEDQLAWAAIGVADKRGPDPAPTDRELADQLVRMKILTPYQVEQLEAGRTKLTLGPYIITDSIAQGGMGQVYKAVHSVLGRESAVKVLPKHKSTPQAISNFQREMRTQAQLDHPNLVRVYDAGHDGSVHYLVIEFVPGQDLRRLVRSQGPLTMRQAASVVRQAALGLEYAHQRGLIHRDVKPGNILVTPEGEAKVSDLGFAGFMHEDTPELRGKIVGTADYLSPEQIRNPDTITPVSDLYSLGCTLYYAVTGKVPFPGGDPREKARRHCEELPMHPRRFNAEVTEEFVEIIADMMEKDPSRRVPTAGEVAARLEPWAEKTSSLAPIPRLGRSPWQAPPLPANGEDPDDTNVGALEEVDARDDSVNQASQWTDRSGGSQETRGLREPPHTTPGQHFPPPSFSTSFSSSFGSTEPARIERTLTRGVAVAIALAVSIPLSMFLGAVIALVLFTVLRGG